MCGSEQVTEAFHFSDLWRGRPSPLQPAHTYGKSNLWYAVSGTVIKTMQSVPNSCRGPVPTCAVGTNRAKNEFDLFHIHHRQTSLLLIYPWRHPLQVFSLWFHEVVINVEGTIGHFIQWGQVCKNGLTTMKRPLWGQTSWHMNTVGPVESTGVAVFKSSPSYAAQRLLQTTAYRNIPTQQCEENCMRLAQTGRVCKGENYGYPQSSFSFRYLEVRG